MRMMSEPPRELVDDLGVADFLEHLKNHIQYFKVRGEVGETLQFGPVRVSLAAYVNSLEQFIGETAGPVPQDQFFNILKERFYFFEVYGGKKWGDVLVTGYYEPLIPGSRTPTPDLSMPLYRLPKDLVSVRLRPFVQVRPKLENIEKVFLEQRSSEGVLRGRLVQSSDSTVPVVIPYFSREQIDADGELRGRGLEIVWVDPIHSFMLQIQGSGVVGLPDGSLLRLGYAAQNGHPYVPIGLFLRDRIPLDKMSMQAIESVLRSMEPDLRDQILYQNPSYVFFEELKGRGKTVSGIEVMDGRTIATDTRYFPKGALAFLQFQRPQFDGPQSQTPSTWIPTGRLVFDQDTGGAIRGTHRVDLFFGEGKAAEQEAGVMKERGQLYYLVPKALL
jgi:membrane-bound lytic murein transglycosylase A